MQAAGSGNRTAARDYFLDAAAANPHYDLALWNLGVLKMQEGIGVSCAVRPISPVPSSAILLRHRFDGLPH
ncbi:MAG: hypothetical protein R2839_06940 [Thermomicrobiales bacterium]